ncbi:hypothetical protein GGX14DRAFT_574946 [Mycena pura]|uniref:Uncharacterized protein n=1 Tax=Mycena pura TaxID=153505 RepID=A0AAD6UW03_9AGAR|nr:hypothetical protein GGX14DRAFT_574946 [Mycena pura]
MSTHPHDPAPHHVPASATSFTSPRARQVAELKITDHSTSPSAAHPSRELERPPKQRSRRCFVCGTTGNFRNCPRTAVLLRRSLAMINDDGRLVSIDGSPLPMMRHPGGVAAHLISRFRNPARLLSKPPKLSRAPRDHTASPPAPPFNSSSPHAAPPIAPAPDYIPYRHSIPHYKFASNRAQTAFLVLLLECLIDLAFRSQLRVLLNLLDTFSALNPATLRQRIEPVFERIYHFVPPT